MPVLTRTKNLRLHLVSETPDAKGNYPLTDFEDADYNQVFPDSRIDEEFQAVIDHLLGGGSGYLVDGDVETDNDGYIHIDLGNDDWLSVPDIREQIEANPDTSYFYVLVGKTLEEFCWVVCESCGTIYQG